MDKRTRGIRNRRNRAESCAGGIGMQEERLESAKALKDTKIRFSNLFELRPGSGHERLPRLLAPLPIDSSDDAPECRQLCI